MNDLTCIFMTVNRVPEKWAGYHKSVLLEAIGDTPLIIVSKKPMNWGSLNIIQEAEPSVNNIYKQILKASKIATTPYIAIAEDDTLYHKSHFEFRPPPNTYAYDGIRWGLFTWGSPFYYYKERISNAAMIASRQDVIDSLEERFARYPNSSIGELGKEKGTNLNRRQSMFYYPKYGMVFFSHINSLDPTEQHRSKKPGAVKAFDIPYWGRADLLKEHFV